MSEQHSRYILGIDLGTTNSVVAFVDTQQAQGAAEETEPEVKTFAIPQLVAPGVVEARPQLPSFIYLAAGPELKEGALDLPWAEQRRFAVGEFAREQGAEVPAQLVSSAKSWLCHAGVDRNAPLLPDQAPESVQQISPVDAATMVLEHIRDAWNHQMAADDETHRLERQTIFLTVPASFDAVARELTVTAARRAELGQMTLLEEPQAAFYAWLAQMGESWRDQLRVGDRVLVCDVGGGTTDFSLIAVRDREGDLELERIAVGQHILLGGDNMDLALAYAVANKLSQHNLDAWQSRSLWHVCRKAKEQLLSQPDLEQATVTILGRGSRVIGGSIRSEVTRQEIEQILVGGFLPPCSVADKPQVARRVGLQEVGLPYAQDVAITKHLAKFIAADAVAGGGEVQQALPSVVLFNGGVMRSDHLRGRIVDTLNQWLAASGNDPVRTLDANCLDTAVAHGGAYYGLVRRGNGIRIRGGVPRSYYVGIESAMPAIPGMPPPLKALCVVPFGMEEGSEAGVESKPLAMIVGEPVQFHFFCSTTRKEDPPGTLLDRWAEEELIELAPIHTAMEGQNETGDATVNVTLHSRVTEVGTLDLDLRAEDGRVWKLEYNVREEQS